MHLRSGSYAGALENLDIDVVNFGRVYKNWNVRSARADCLVEGFEGILPTLEGGDARQERHEVIAFEPQQLAKPLLAVVVRAVLGSRALFHGYL